MNAPAKITLTPAASSNSGDVRPLPADAATSDLHIRLMMSAALNGQFDGLPLNLFTKLDWIDAAQWLADVEGEPMDEAQAIAEIELMLVKSDYFDRWQHLPEARRNAWAGCFESYFDARRAGWAA